MKRFLAVCMLVVGLSFAAMAATSDKPVSTQVTFNKDVLPILQKNCQTCHRPGEVAPMPLLTYQDARPYARSIKTKVLSRKMPPWFADPKYGHFSNEHTLTTQEINALVAWVDSGAPEGDAKDKPAPLQFVEGWNIGLPDRVVEMPVAFEVPAQGTIDYQYVVIPLGLTQDTWVQAAEIRPGNRAVVHHVLAYIRPPGSPWLRDLKPGELVPLKMPDGERAQGQPRGRQRGEGGASGILGAEHLVGYAPGTLPLNLGDSAKLVKAGSDLVFQLHYTANGKPAKDQTKIGLIFAKAPPKLRELTLMAPNVSFAIPPNDGNYEVTSEVELEGTVTLSRLTPHMHFRGKDFLYKVVYPSGETVTLLSVPHYDFNWQLGYTLAEPMVLPKGTRIQCIAHFDNSANNAFNPDPTKTVRWGEQTWEEMMIGYFSVTVDPAANTEGLTKMLGGSAKSSLAVQSPSATPTTPAESSRPPVPPAQ
jgi:mono/diheme cytochrome c family protein